MRLLPVLLVMVFAGLAPRLAAGQGANRSAKPAILIKNVSVFNGIDEKIARGRSVLVVGNKIAKIKAGLIEPPEGTTVIDAGGRVLMPGLIDAHIHLTINMPPAALKDVDLMYLGTRTALEAERTLMRGFTTVRDTGGPVFGIKRAIDEALIKGPRIYPSGAMITQTSGHGDFRSRTDLQRRFGGRADRFELIGACIIADGESEVLAAVREQLRLGASQIKLMAGGGVASAYDPLDVSQYREQELKAAVDAANDWGTYVLTHVYNARGMQRCIAAGVKCIEHGHLTDEASMKLMAQKGVFLSTQVLTFLTELPGLSADHKGKLRQAREGTDVMMRLARKHGVKIAWGTDLIGDPRLLALAPKEFAARLKWFTPVEILRQATVINGELLALSGPRNPYPGKLGVIAEGALADLLVIDGNPLENIKILEDPDKSLKIIMKDGKLYKNTLP